MNDCRWRPPTEDEKCRAGGCGDLILKILTLWMLVVISSKLGQIVKLLESQ